MESLVRPSFSAVGDHERLLTVRAITPAADGVITIELADPAGGDLSHWSPGAHIDVTVHGPEGELTRQYSLCGDPADRSHYRIGVLREPESRGGSAYLHESLAVGDDVTVAGPRNHFELVTDAASYIFIAGGIGITPLLPMIAALEARGADWELHYVGRSASTMAFCEELAPYAGRVHLAPRDCAPRPDLAGLLAEHVPGRVVYSCGPDALLDSLEETMAAAGWAPGALHTERFTPIVVDRSGDEAFEIELANAGLTLTVPADQSIFATVREAGVSVLGSCLEGTCGTCETEIVEWSGEIEHRDTVLTAEERETNETLMLCVSRCRGGRLTLDL